MIYGLPFLPTERYGKTEEQKEEAKQVTGMERGTMEDKDKRQKSKRWFKIRYSRFLIIPKHSICDSDSVTHLEKIETHVSYHKMFI